MDAKTKKKALDYIASIQAIQQRNPMDSVEWLMASKELHKMFRYMERNDR